MTNYIRGFPCQNNTCEWCKEDIFMNELSAKTGMIKRFNLKENKDYHLECAIIAFADSKSECSRKGKT